MNCFACCSKKQMFRYNDCLTLLYASLVCGRRENAHAPAKGGRNRICAKSAARDCWARWNVRPPLDRKEKQLRANGSHGRAHRWALSMRTAADGDDRLMGSSY
jgi:hypothetical protein